jgi:molybdopterin-containing oxidoreductase family iron-sulfur binding subunit
MPSENRHINFELMRERVLSEQERSGRDARGPSEDGTSIDGPSDYWRSLEELVDAPEFREFVEREYPQHAEEWDDPVERRTFLKLMGASLALAGLSGCVYQPAEKIIPYVKQPEEEVPSKALFFATAASLGGIATPLLARSNEGRPTKVEGNPDHPNSRNGDKNDRGSSATDIFAQASLLTLYDPDRSQTPVYREETRPWSTFVAEMRTTLEGPNGNDGLRVKQAAGLRFLTETVTSPTLAAQLKGLLAEFPQAKWHQYEPVNRDNARAGAVMAFGEPVNTIYDFSKGERILSLDADFLACLPGSLRYARDFAARRRITEGQKEMSRLYVVQTTPTTTGASADHRWSVRPSELAGIAQAIAALLPTASPVPILQKGVAQPLLGHEGPFAASSDKGSFQPANWMLAVVKDLEQHKGSSIVIAGHEAPPLVHALAHAMNEALGNVGKTVFYTDPIEANSVDQTQSLRELVNDIDAGQVELLVIVGGNPAYNTPADLKLDFERLKQVKRRVHLSLYRDETSELCHWHIPEAHYLESWSDTRSPDGTVSIVQPLIEPLYEGKSAHELLTAFSQQQDRKPYDIIRDYWRGQQAAVSAGGSKPPAGQTARPAAAASVDFESWWRKCVHDGYIPETELPTKTFALKLDTTATNAGGTPAVPVTAGAVPTGPRPPTPDSQFEIVFRTDPTIYDGRFANNGWLQELPKPLTKLTWDNAALVSPNTAQRLFGFRENEFGYKGGDHDVPSVDLEYQGRTLRVAVWILPGQPNNVVTVHLGYGRTSAGRVGNQKGFNAYSIRTSTAPWSGSGVKITKATEKVVLATTQLHFNVEGRDILRSTTLVDYLKGHVEYEGQTEMPSREDTLYPNDEHNYKDQGEGALNYAWGMAIDVNSCVGCNACIVACQSENNIPVVGKEQVLRRREMQWLRVDTYFKGSDPNNPEGPYFMPLPCMHCENAPCEPVCPVRATVHSAEGINDMVYNRCVGTRYCSNNCPYKVRHFNFLLYQDWETPTYQLMRNPDVSVRSRGVMEKCTYCIQRIQGAKIQSEIEGRPVRDGEIVTACQSVCPTEAIVFGNINDPKSKVSKLKAEQRNYSLLGELNTRPRTTYLSALRNPNPEIAEKH